MLVTTGFGELLDRVHLPDAGIVALLSKPFHTAALKDCRR